MDDHYNVRFKVDLISNDLVLKLTSFSANFRQFYPFLAKLRHLHLWTPNFMQIRKSL